MKEPLPVPTLSYGYGSSPQAAMTMYQAPASLAQQYPQVRDMEWLLSEIVLSSGRGCDKKKGKLENYCCRVWIGDKSILSF